MRNRLFGIFSGTHLTVIACVAISVPTALYGAVTYSRVEITGPNGTTAAISNNSLSTIDLYARYRDNPYNYRVISVSNSGEGCEVSGLWTVPSGKAFVITAISGYEYQHSSTASNYAGYSIFDGANCGGHRLTTHVSSTTSSLPVAPIAVEFGAGIPVAAGSTIGVYSFNNGGFTHIHGFLCACFLDHDEPNFGIAKCIGEIEARAMTDTDRCKTKDGNLFEAALTRGLLVLLAKTPCQAKSTSFVPSVACFEQHSALRFWPA